MWRDIFLCKKYLKNHWIGLTIFYLLSIISWLISITIPLITGQYIDTLININVDMIYTYTKILVIMVVLKIFISYFKNIIDIKIRNKIIFEFNYDVLEYVKKVEIEYFHNVNTTYLNQRINMDCSSIISFVFDNILNIFMNVLTVIFITILIIKLNYKISIFLILLIPINIIIYLMFKNKIYSTSYEMNEFQNKYFSYMNDQLFNVKLIKINSWYKAMGEFLKEKFNVLLKYILSFSRVQIVFNQCRTVLVDISTIILFFIGGFEVINGKLTVGGFSIINNYFLMLLNSTSYFLTLGQAYQNMLVSYSRLKELLSLKQDFNGSYKLKNVKSITLRNLQFKYKNSNTLITDISYDFKCGNIYCVLGENGSGKSTLIDLMLGLYSDYSGEIYYNDINIRNIDMEFAREKMFGITQQEPRLINSTLIDNLTYSLSEVSTEDLKFYCKSLNLYDYIMNLPDKYNYIVSNDSHNLSGGEKQKISIIHNLVKNPDVLVFDEPTSAMDNVSIKQFKDILTKLKANKIIIIITHDIGLLDIADKIINLPLGGNN